MIQITIIEKIRRTNANITKSIQSTVRNIEIPKYRDLKEN